MELSICFLEILMQLIRIQNEQLIKIICKEEEIEYNDLKKVIPTPYELKEMLKKI